MCCCGRAVPLVSVVSLLLFLLSIPPLPFHAFTLLFTFFTQIKKKKKGTQQLLLTVLLTPCKSSHVHET